MVHVENLISCIEKYAETTQKFLAQIGYFLTNRLIQILIMN